MKVKMKMLNNNNDLIHYLKIYVPQFNIAFKDQSRFMRFLGTILFFNKRFMTEYITTIGYTIYFPNQKNYEENPARTMNILTHEFVHMMDYSKYKFLFTLSYLFPQCLCVLSLLSLLAIWFSNWWLLSLLFLLCLLPIPAYFRSHWELRGYTMDMAFNYWDTNNKNTLNPTLYLDEFTGSGYYYMWPFAKNMTKRFQKMIDRVINDSILLDKPYQKVYAFVRMLKILL